MGKENKKNKNKRPSFLPKNLKDTPLTFNTDINFKALLQLRKTYDQIQQDIVRTNVQEAMRNAVKIPQEVARSFSLEVLDDYIKTQEDIVRSVQYNNAVGAYIPINEQLKEIQKQSKNFFIWSIFIAFLSGAFFYALSAHDLKAFYRWMAVIVFVGSGFLIFMLPKVSLPFLSNIIKNVKIKIKQ